MTTSPIELVEVVAAALESLREEVVFVGFSNRWFPGAFRAAQPHELPSGTSIRIVTAPYFLATKFEAFLGRGGADYMASKDMEDIVAVLHGREEIVEDIRDAAADVREYLVDRAVGLSSAPEFEIALAGHLPGEDTDRVMQRVAQIVAPRDDAGD